MQTPKAEESVPMDNLVEATGDKESELQASGGEELSAENPGMQAKGEISEECESGAKEDELAISEEEEASPGLLISEIEERGPQTSGEDESDSKGSGFPVTGDIDLDIEEGEMQASGEGGADSKGPGLQIIGDKEPEAKEPANAEKEPGTAEPGARDSGEEEMEVVQDEPVVDVQGAPDPSPSREERQAARAQTARGASRGVLRGGRRGIRCSRCGARGSLSRSTRGMPPSYVRPHMRNHMDRNHHM